MSEKSEHKICWSLLSKVSRSFDLAIHALPESLGLEVCISYLIFRIVDTIEDAPKLPDRARYFREFIQALADEDTAGFDFVTVANSAENENERALVMNTAEILHAFSQFRPATKEAIRKYTFEMADGMEAFCSRKDSGARLIGSDEELDLYCYAVAGTVGLLLTELFADYSNLDKNWIESQSKAAIAFGLGLQKVNILRDMNTDQDKGVSYFSNGLSETAARRMAASALENLKVAEDFILNIPSDQAGIRTFCVWPYLTALLCLDKVLTATPLISPGKVVKIEKEVMFEVMEKSSQLIESNHAIGDMMRKYTMRCVEHYIN